MRSRDGYKSCTSNVRWTTSRNALFTLLNKYVLIPSVWSKAQRLKTLILSWGRGISVLGEKTGLSMFNWKEHCGERQLSEYMVLAFLCMFRQKILLLSMWMSTPAKNKLSATNTACIQKGNFFRESYRPVSNNHQEERIFFSIPFLQQSSRW